MTLTQLYDKAIETDVAWQAALAKRYGRRCTDARYDARGEATPELRALKQAKIEADRAHLAGMRARDARR